MVGVWLFLLVGEKAFVQFAEDVVFFVLAYWEFGVVFGVHATDAYLRRGRGKSLVVGLKCFCKDDH